jgi:hypothetical protein
MSTLYFLKAWGISGEKTGMLFHKGERCDSPIHAWAALLEKVRQDSTPVDIVICSIKKESLDRVEFSVVRAYKRKMVNGVVEYVRDESFHF